MRRPLRRENQPPERPTSQRSAAQLLLDSGIFDVEFYSAATGRDFPTELDAARHCARSGMRHSLSPNPLLDIGSVPLDLRPDWRAGKVAKVLHYLRSDLAHAVPPGPLFDPASAPGSRAEQAGHPGGVLGLFLERADSGTALPVPPGYVGRPPTLGEARKALIDVVRRTHEQQRLTGARTTETWDLEAERAWRSAWDSVQPPVPTDGPLVSVIMPVRNRPTVLAEAIESVLGQTLRTWELVVVDDGSTDDTPEVAARYAAADPRIKLVRAEHGGVSAARNRGLAVASGRFVAFLDSDNTWRADFLHLTLAVMTAEGLSAAYAGARMVDPTTKSVRYRAFEGGLAHLLVQNHIDLNTFVVSRAVALEAGGFDEGLRRWVDHDFAIRVARLSEPRLLPFIACDYDHHLAAERITTTEHESWQFVALEKNLVDWQAVSRGLPDRVSDRVSVVVPTYHDWRMTVAATTSVLEDADRSGLDVEVLIVDNGSQREVGTQIVGAFLTEPRVRYRRLPRNVHFATGCNIGFAASSGATVAFLNNDTVVRPGWLTAMLPHLRDPEVRGVQPLLLYADDTIQTAGTVFAADGFLPTHLLVGHPPEDAVALPDKRFSAVTAAALLMRADEVCELKGFDPLYVNGMEDVDLCLRATERYQGAFVMEPRARVTHLESKSRGRGAMISANRQRFIERWAGRLPRPDVDRCEGLGFRVAHLMSDEELVPSARPLLVRDRPDPDTARPALRWGLKLPSIPGPAGDAWGDTHLASSLADALAALGQEVVTYRHGAHASSASHLDDVVLGIRGLDVIAPHPGKVNILWVISHPDDVDPDEFRGFDLVYAASEPWAARMSEVTGREVIPLHQAVDIRNLPDRKLPVGSGEKPVFVGATHARRTRQAVLDAVAADIGLVIHGPGWEGTPAQANVVSTYVPNAELTALYRQHGMVLADHWPDMAENGFVANRVFDAVASGARVVSDAVPGIEELFSGAVRTFSSVDDLHRLFGGNLSDHWPEPGALEAISQQVAHEHSFDMRARVLLEAALDAYRGRARG